jgi:lysophospholipase L1-like esterase
MSSLPNQAPTVPLRPGLQNGDRILFEGDSLSDGLRNNYARMLGWDKTWAHLVDEWLFLQRPELELECGNLAVGGSSAETMLARVDAAADFRPTVAMLTIGTNDASRKVGEETFRRQLSEWCAKLQSSGCRTFLLVGGFPPCPNADEEARGRLECCKGYWHAGREAVAAHGGFFIDVATYMRSRAEALDKRWNQHTVYSCGVHYNAVGHQLIAGAVLTALGFWASS